MQIFISLSIVLPSDHFFSAYFSWYFQGDIERNIGLNCVSSYLLSTFCNASTIVTNNLRNSREQSCTRLFDCRMSKSFQVRQLHRMHEVRSSNPPVVTGICDLNNSWAWKHRITKLVLQSLKQKVSVRKAK